MAHAGGFLEFAAPLVYRAAWSVARPETHDRATATPGSPPPDRTELPGDGVVIPYESIPR